MVDILPEISGVDFDRAWQRRVEAVIDPASGLTALSFPVHGLGDSDPGSHGSAIKGPCLGARAVAGADDG